MFVALMTPALSATTTPGAPAVVPISICQASQRDEAPATVSVDALEGDPVIWAMPPPPPEVLRTAPARTSKATTPLPLFATVSARLVPTLAEDSKMPPPESTTRPPLTENLPKPLLAPVSVQVPEPRLSIEPGPVIWPE